MTTSTQSTRRASLPSSLAGTRTRFVHYNKTVSESLSIRVVLQITEADLKLARRIIQEELGGKKTTQERGETMKKLEELAGDAYFMGVSMKTVEVSPQSE